MNTNIPAKRQETSPALTKLEALETFADAVVGLDALLVKFTRGDWTIGRDNEPVQAGDRFIALVPGLRHGYTQWENAKPVSRRMVLVADHPLAPARDELGDRDELAWPRDKNGEPIDPWQFTAELPLLDVETRAARLYVTSSSGGHQALGKLARAYSQQMRKHPGTLPVIELGSETYKHKLYGNVDKPLFLVFDWVADPGWSPSEVSAGPASYAAELDDEIPFEMPWK